MLALVKIGEGPIWPTDGVLKPFADCFGGLGCGPLLWEDDPMVFLIMTILIAGGCAFMSGRSVALSWKSLTRLMFYMVLFGFAVRFLHWGLFQGTLMSPWYYLSDTLVLMALAWLGYRYTRAVQMTTQYRWLYRRTGPLSWSTTS